MILMFTFLLTHAKFGIKTLRILREKVLESISNVLCFRNRFLILSIRVAAHSNFLSYFENQIQLIHLSSSQFCKYGSKFTIKKPIIIIITSLMIEQRNCYFLIRTGMYKIYIMKKQLQKIIGSTSVTNLCRSEAQLSQIKCSKPYCACPE